MEYAQLRNTKQRLFWCVGTTVERKWSPHPHPHTRARAPAALEILVLKLVGGKRETLAYHVGLPQ